MECPSWSIFNLIYIKLRETFAVPHIFIEHHGARYQSYKDEWMK